MKKVFLAVAALAAIAPVSPAEAAMGVTVSRSGVLNPLVAAGKKVTALTVVSNSRRTPAPGGTVRFLLSTDGRPGGRDKLLGTARFGRLGARRSRQIKTRLELPRKLAARSYHLLACAPACPRKPTARVSVRPKATAVDVAPQLDGAEKSVSAVISTDGGRLDAIASDGVLYSLLVPAGALERATRITMTPLRGVGGLPFAGGLVGGVQLGPDGLELARPASLIISGERIRTAPGQVAFGYHGAGRGLHLEPFFRRLPAEAQGEGFDPSRQVVLPVMHFSGAGVAPATTLEAARQLRYGAMEARDRLAQQTADVIAKERDRQLQGQGEDPADLSRLLEGNLGAYLEQVVIPEAAAASFSDAMFESAVRDYIGWERQRELLGAGGDRRWEGQVRQVEALLRAAFKELVKRAEDRCYKGDFTVATKMLALERTRQLLAGSGGFAGFADDDVNLFERIMDRCFRFELRVVSHVEHHGRGSALGVTGTEDWTFDLRGTVPLTLTGGELTGTAPFTYSVVSVSDEGDLNWEPIGRSHCKSYSTGQTQPGQITVSAGSFGSLADGRQKIDPVVTLDPGSPQEQVHHDCQSTVGGSSDSVSEDRWESYFMKYWKVAHASDSMNAGGRAGQPDDAGPWALDRFALAGPHPLLARKAIAVDDASYGYSVKETWELVHTPLKRR
jgi:hypothetical protein